MIAEFALPEMTRGCPVVLPAFANFFALSTSVGRLPTRHASMIIFVTKDNIFSQTCVYSDSETGLEGCLLFLAESSMTPIPSVRIARSLVLTRGPGSFNIHLRQKSLLIRCITCSTLIPVKEVSSVFTTAPAFPVLISSQKCRAGAGAGAALLLRRLMLVATKLWFTDRPVWL